MAVPTQRTDLSATVADNVPAGTESLGTNADNYIRAHAGFIKQNYDDIQGKQDELTITAFGESLIDDVDAEAARTTLELGTAATSDIEDFASADITTGHGQCHLALDGTDLTLSPYGGNTLIIDGTGETIPSAGVTLSTSGFTVDTTYYIYAYMDASTMTLEASATGHTAHTDGVEIKTGDSTRTLVGMARTDGTDEYVASWFNRNPTYSSATFTTNRTLTTSTATEVNTEIRVNVLTWGDLDIRTAGAAAAASAGGQAVYTYTYIDGSTEATYMPLNSYHSGSAMNTSCTAASSVSEGFHYVTVFGKTDSSITGTWFSGFKLTVGVSA